jgi:hypothetical protein
MSPFLFDVANFSLALVVCLRLVLAPAFQAGALVLFIRWRVGAEAPSGAANSGRPVLADGWADFFLVLTALTALSLSHGPGR